MSRALATFNTPTQLQRDLNAASGAALILLIWDWLITFDDEVELIWSKPNQSWLKWLFLFSRYYILFATFSNRSIEVAITYDYHLSVSCLRVWYSCQVVVALHAMCALEIVLMTRVYALYNKQKSMAYSFIALILLENTIVLVGIVVNLPDKSFQPFDIITRLPRSFSYFGFSTMAVQIVILILTLYRYMSGDWKTVPLVKLMFRDGSLAFLTLSLFVMTMTIYTVLRIPFAIAGFSWLLTAISCITCRLIINMQRLPINHGHTNASTGIQFTTFFSSAITAEDTSSPSLTGQRTQQSLV